MKKVLFVFALGAMLGSCGGGAADLDVESLDSPCGCTEAAVSVMDELIGLYSEAKDMGADASDSDKERIEKEGKALEEKMSEIETKCVGDLAADKAGEDCEALKELPKKMEELANAMSGK